MAFSLAEIASWINAVVDGDETLEITGLAKIEEAGPGELTFIANPRYEKYLSDTAAAAVIGFLTAQGTVRRWLRQLP